MADDQQSVRPIHQDDVFMLNNKDYNNGHPLSSGSSHDSYRSGQQQSSPHAFVGNGRSIEMIYEKALKNQALKVQQMNRFISSASNKSRYPSPGISSGIAQEPTITGITSSSGFCSSNSSISSQNSSLSRHRSKSRISNNNQGRQPLTKKNFNYNGHHHHSQLQQQRRNFISSNKSTINDNGWSSTRTERTAPTTTTNNDRRSRQRNVGENGDYNNGSSITHYYYRGTSDKRGRF